MEIIISDEIRAAAPAYKVIVLTADVHNPPTPDALWQELSECHRQKGTQDMAMVNKTPAIAATRAAYKALGKDPNRYRPSAEPLTRRAVKGLELYRTTAIVDLVNLLSLASGHSIGAFDADAIAGTVLTLGRGREGEPYEAIGRGQLNIDGLPVWRGAKGGHPPLPGTANLYGPSVMSDDEFTAMMVRLLRDYADAANIEINTYGA